MITSKDLERANIEQANIEQANIKKARTITDIEFLQLLRHQPDPLYWGLSRARLFENLCLIGAFIHSNVFVALLLTLAANGNIWIHFLFWAPFLISSALILYSSEFCRRQAVVCLAISASCLWFEILILVTVPDT